VKANFYPSTKSYSTHTRRNSVNWQHSTAPHRSLSDKIKTTPGLLPAGSSFVPLKMHASVTMHIQRVKYGVDELKITLSSFEQSYIYAAYPYQLKFSTK
jgi:hypothetical protein